jgi:group I intron endonuclease
MIGIYKITNPSNKVYIGQSTNIEKRFKTYKLNNCKSQRALYNSFLKYGFDNHKFEIICECDIKELNDKERHYQDLYNVLTNGLNCRLTTSKNKSGNLSLSTKLKIKESNIGKNLGKKHTDESKIKISKSSKGNKHNLGKKLTDEHKIKISLSIKGRNHSKESILKMSESKKGIKLSDEHKQKLSISHIGKKLSEKHKLTFRSYKTNGGKQACLPSELLNVTKYKTIKKLITIPVCLVTAVVGCGG